MITRSRSALRVLLCAAVLALPLSTGCIGKGILLTPVSLDQRLTETVVQRDSALARDKIALLDVSGLLMNAESWELFGSGENPVSLLLEQLDRAAADRHVRAVILRVNSPGGSVTASELMHREISEFRVRTGKPVIAVFMDVAASGGYYLACACDEIVAHESTITGSIGVIMQMFNVTGTMQKLGISADAITSGRYKDAGSPLRTMKPDERILFQAMVDDMYGRFVKVVDAGRPKLDEARVRELADGRVYTASQALELGLIDRIGTLRDTINQTRTRIGSKGLKVVTYHRPLDYRPNYYAKAPVNPGSGDVNVFNLNLPDWLTSGTPRFMYLWSPGLTNGS
jgi:protease-4